MSSSLHCGSEGQTSNVTCGDPPQSVMTAGAETLGRKGHNTGKGR